MKAWLISLFLTVLLVVSGCTGITGAGVVCDPPDIKVGDSCCLDQNNNKVCDDDEPAPVTEEVVEEKEPEISVVPCPHECCEDNHYEQKSCEKYYECVNNECVPKDSDGDGLSDEEEAKHGTDPKSADTDSDGLNDFQEVKVIGTQATNPNTDRDRYPDGEDKEPRKVSSAKLSVSIAGRGEEIDWGTVAKIETPIEAYIEGGTFESLLSAIGNLSALNYTLYTNHVDLNVANTGDDYTEYFEYEIHVYTADELVKVVESGRRDIKVDADESYSHTLDFPILVEDVLLEKAPNIIEDFENLHFDYRVENVKYEQY